MTTLSFTDRHCERTIATDHKPHPTPTHAHTQTFGNGHPNASGSRARAGRGAAREEDFTKGYDRAFMWDLQQTAGIGLDQAAFDAVWEKAATTGPVSVETFRHAMAALDL